jgi:hypothetical protein
MAFWPHTSPETRRSLVVGVLLLSGGGLVWINGGRFGSIAAAGAVLGIGLWIGLLLSPALQANLALTPLAPDQITLVIVATGMALLMAAGVRQRSVEPRQN